jgi:glutamate dehydrogenase
MRLVRFDPLYAALDIAEVAAETNRGAQEVASVYFVIGERFNFSWLHREIGGLPADSHWQALAKAALKDELSGLQRELTGVVLKVGPSGELPDALIDGWEAQNRYALERSRQVFGDLQSAGSVDLSMLSVALQELTNLVLTTR